MAASDHALFTLTSTDPDNRFPAYIGNGLVGLVSTPLGIAASLSFAAGVYDHAPDDVPRIAALPVWNELDIHCCGRRLSEPGAPGALGAYRQVLDMRAGLLRTSYEWHHAPHRLAIEVEVLVSRADPNLAVLRLALESGQAGRVAVRSSLREWPPPGRLAMARIDGWQPDWTIARVWYPGHLVVVDRGPDSLTLRPEGAATTVAVTQSLHIDARRGLRRGDAEISFDLDAGERVELVKYVGIAWGEADPMAIARAAVGRAASLGRRAIRAEHAVAWGRLWETDIVIEGDGALQRLVRAAKFYLVGSVRAESPASVPPMGISSAGYYGHLFWDADTWMFPPLLVMHPELARPIVDFRSRTLPAARRNAHANGYEGAMYPWEADENGEEATPRFAGQNATSEVHVNGDVALAQWQYYLATGDLDWLAREGYPVIRETADFWVSRVTANTAGDRYDIRNVVSVDEDLIGVDNDAFTNVVARRNLEIAVAASARLGRAPDPRWGRIAERLYLPFETADEYHRTYQNARAEAEGSAAPLLAYPLALPMSDRTKRNDLVRAARRLAVARGGPMMSPTLYPIVAAELGDQELVDRLIPLSYERYVRGPFLAFAETPHNDAVHFLTGAGGFLQQVIFGYAGLRISDEGLVAAFKPVLPSQVRRIVLQGFAVRGRKQDIVVDREGARLDEEMTRRG